MALHPVISIDLDDSKFKEFNALFQKYREHLKAMPGHWAEVAAGVKVAKSEFDGLQDRVKELENAIKGVGRNKDRLKQEAEESASTWGGISSATSHVASNISNATTSLLKWSVITGAFTGLLGAGGLFGMDRWAASIANTRRSALGLGIGFGQQTAFTNNFGRFLDPNALLTNVNAGQFDYTSPQYLGLRAAGVSPGSIAGKNAAGVSIEFLHNMDRLLANTPRGLIGPKAEALGLTNNMSLEDIIRYHNASPEEKRTQEQRYLDDAKTQDLSAKAQRAWTDFTTQMQRAGLQVEKTFAEGLREIEPGLEHLSDAFAKALDAFLKSDTLKDWIKAASDGLEHFAKFVGTKEFEDDVSGFAQDFGDIVKALGDLVGGFRGIAKFGNDIAHILNKLAGIPDDQSNVDDASPSVDPSIKSRIRNFTGNAGVGGWWTPDRIKHAVQYLQEHAGLSAAGAAGLVARWSAIESPGGPTSVNPSSGAAGIAQGLGSRRAGYLGDFEAQLANAAQELNTTEKRAGDALRAAKDVAAAAIGASMFERAEAYNAQTGTDAYTASTPVQHVMGIISGLGLTGAQARPSITVHANTGNNPVMSAALVAQPTNAGIGMQ